MERLCDVLEVRRGVTAVIGGGGKTSLLYRLASELRERGRVLVATTTRILPPAHLPVCHDREGTLRALRANGIACAGTPAEGGKLAEPSFADWMTLADYTLVEADGSKGLPAQGARAARAGDPAAEQSDDPRARRGGAGADGRTGGAPPGALCAPCGGGGGERGDTCPRRAHAPSRGAS